MSLVYSLPTDFPVPAPVATTCTGTLRQQTGFLSGTRGLRCQGRPLSPRRGTETQPPVSNRTGFTSAPQREPAAITAITTAAAIIITFSCLLVPHQPNKCGMCRCHSHAAISPTATTCHLPRAIYLLPFVLPSLSHGADISHFHDELTVKISSSHLHAGAGGETAEERAGQRSLSHTRWPRDRPPAANATVPPTVPKLRIPFF